MELFSWAVDAVPLEVRTPNTIAKVKLLKFHLLSLQTAMLGEEKQDRTLVHGSSTEDKPLDHMLNPKWASFHSGVSETLNNLNVRTMCILEPLSLQ